MHYVAGDRNLRADTATQMQQHFKHLKQVHFD